MSRKERSCFLDFRSVWLSLKLTQKNSCLNIAKLKKPADLSSIIFLASNLFMQIFSMFVTYL